MEREPYNANPSRRLAVESPTELSRRVDKELDADRTFFRRWPEREHYIRRIFPNERLQMEFHGGQNISFDPLTHAIFVVVKKVYSNARVRVVFTAPRDIETDLSERDALAIFDGALSEKIKEIVAFTKAAAQP